MRHLNVLRRVWKDHPDMLAALDALMREGAIPERIEGMATEIAVAAKRDKEERKCYEVHIFDQQNGFSVFFRATIIDPTNDAIAAHAVRIGKVDSEYLRYVDYAKEITEEEYQHAKPH